MSHKITQAKLRKVWCGKQISAWILGLLYFATQWSQPRESVTLPTRTSDHPLFPHPIYFLPLFSTLPNIALKHALYNVTCFRTKHDIHIYIRIMLNDNLNGQKPALSILKILYFYFFPLALFVIDIVIQLLEEYLIWAYDWFWCFLVGNGSIIFRCNILDSTQSQNLMVYLEHRFELKFLYCNWFIF